MPHSRGQVGQYFRIGEEFHARHGSVPPVPIEKGLYGPIAPATPGELVHLGHGFGAQNPVG